VKTWMKVALFGFAAIVGLCIFCAILGALVTPSNSTTTAQGSPAPIGTAVEVTLLPTDPTIPSPQPASPSPQQPTLSPTSEPTIEPTTVTPTTEPVVDDNYQSGGLGLSRQAWEDRHGAPGQKIGGFISYEGTTYAVAYQMDNVWHLEKSWGSTGVSLDEARAESKTLIPSDSQLQQTYTSANDQLVDLYTSEALKSRFPESQQLGSMTLSMWPGGEPGDFIVIYRRTGDRVTSIVLGIGNNT
jgi:hypothetical protein